MALGLEQPLLIITVSDFLADGAAEVEARAKGIFLVLEEQKDMVILFDEIDQFLLDRNSQRYREQTGIFQFLTPGMLTKFQDLKDAQRSIFIVATNYGERIDSAIKRQGRFDERLLLSLPDTQRRKEMLRHFLKKQLEAAKLSEADAAKRSSEIMDGAEELLERTVLFGYGDLKHLVKSYVKIRPDDRLETVGEQLLEGSKSVQPAVKLSAYASRVNDETRPLEEFAILLYLVGECGAHFKPEDEEIVTAMYSDMTAQGIATLVQGSDRVKAAVRAAIDRARA